jgi:tripartite-type tricarboxylate transporter receptor subunit TctC
MVMRRWMSKQSVIGVLALASSSGVAQAASAPDAHTYPYKPIRIVTSGVGGGSDFTARRVAEGISGPLGQPVVVENRGGGGAGTGGIVARATPDGYTLLVGSNSLWVGPLFDTMPYDMEKDFAPVSTTSIAPLALVVHPTVPANSVKELIALGKAQPGKLNYGSSAIGSSIHFAAELFKSMAGVNFVRIPYKGGGDVVIAVTGNQVQLIFASGSIITPQIKAGRVRALAVTSAEPSALLPGLPTMASAGLPGYEVIGLDGILATAGTPSSVIHRLNEAIVRHLGKPETKERFFSTGVEAFGSTPEDFAARIKSETSTIARLMKGAGVHAQ